MQTNEDILLKDWYKQNKKPILRACVFVFLCVWGGYLLFGSQSFEVLFTLQKQQKALVDEIDSLQKQNAKIQQEIFELKGLES